MNTNSQRLLLVGSIASLMLVNFALITVADEPSSLKDPAGCRGVEDRDLFDHCR